MTAREELLLRMYDQMFNDINRHIMVVWQSIGVIIGAFAILALVEKHVVSLDIAVTVILLLCVWLLAQLLDSAYWYNRNLVIIANIERQFLTKYDLHDIHYYFGRHREKNKMIEHLRIQGTLGYALAFLVLLYHFAIRVVPGFGLSWRNFELVRAVPYSVAVASVIYLIMVGQHTKRKYEGFVRNSPGIPIDTTGVDYSVGHGQNRQGILKNLFARFSAKSK